MNIGEILAIFREFGNIPVRRDWLIVFVSMGATMSAIGFNKNDIPNLIKGTLPQHRVTKLSPRSANAEDLNKLFNDSMTLW